MVRRAVVVGVLLCVLAQVAVAKEKQKEGSVWGDAGWGLLAVTANLLYMPAKVVYASVGTITGGLAYLLTAGDSETAQRVWNPSIGGSYVITPAMLRGDEEILFNGPSYSND